ncbi:MAG: DegT/DnrJ/EryC1/StrS family aminotransferase [Conexibacter sp.]
MTITSSTDSTARLALLGGTPVRTPESRQYPVWSDEAKRHVARLLDDGVALGLSKLQPEMGAVERALGEFHGVPHVLGTSTGNGALHAALIGLELTDGDEVMTSPYTYGVTISCILQNNCIATFADVIEGTGLLDPASVRERLTPRTRAILVPHIFGNPADMTALCEIAAEHDLKIIEDGSQAHGARHRGRRIGAFGDAAGFSANGVKPIAATEGGYLLTQHEDVYWKAVVSTQHAGMTEFPGRASEGGFPEELRAAIDGLVYTYRLTPVNAVLMADALQRVEGENDVRRRHLALLREGLADLPSVSIPPLLHEGDESAVHQAVVWFDAEAAGVSKQTYIEALNAEGLYSYEYMRRPVHRAPRLSPEWSGPRVMWTENLRRADYDPTKLELPHAENQVRSTFNLVWNYVDYDPAFIGGMVDAFAKVEENIDALRAHERANAGA